MELTALAKLIDISISVGVLIFIYVQTRKDYARKNDELKQFTDRIMEENKEREKHYLSVIEELSEKFDIINEVKDNVDKLSKKVEGFVDKFN